MNARAPCPRECAETAAQRRICRRQVGPPTRDWTNFTRRARRDQVHCPPCSVRLGSEAAAGRRRRAGPPRPADVARRIARSREERAARRLCGGARRQGHAGLALARPARPRPAAVLARRARGAGARRRARAGPLARDPADRQRRPGRARARQRARVPRRARRARARRPARGRRRRGDRRPRPAAPPSAARAADRRGHTRRPAAAARPDADRRRADRHPRARPRVHRGRDRGAAHRGGHRARRRGGEPAVAAHRRVGCRAAARRAHAPHPRRPVAVRGRVRRRRRGDGRLPAGRGARAAARRPRRLPPAHGDRRRRQRRPRRRADRAATTPSTCSSSSSASTRSSPRSATTATGIATTRCCASCCARSCGSGSRATSDRSTRARRAGTSTPAGPRRRSITPPTPATGSWSRRSQASTGCRCSSAASWRRCAGRSRACRRDAAATTRRWRSRSRPRCSTSATSRPPASSSTTRVERRDAVPAARRKRFDLGVATVGLLRARLRGDLDKALGHAQAMIGSETAAARTDAGSTDLRALALVNLGIAELWTGALDDARRDLEAARRSAEGGERDWLLLLARHAPRRARRAHRQARARAAPRGGGDHARHAPGLGALLAGRARRRAC